MKLATLLLVLPLASAMPTKAAAEEAVGAALIAASGCRMGADCSHNHHCGTGTCEWDGENYGGWAGTYGGFKKRYECKCPAPTPQPTSAPTPQPTLAPITATGLLPNTLYTIRGGHDSNDPKYCAAEDTQMKCDRTAIGSWEKYTLESQGNGLYAIKANRQDDISSSKKYCADDTTLMVCDRTTIGDWEQFTIEPLPNEGANKYAIKAGIRTRDGQKKYCSDRGDKIECTHAARQAWEVFTITPTV